MTTWYQTSAYNPRISPVEILAFTKDSVTIEHSTVGGHGRNITRKARRIGDRTSFFPTFREARNHLMTEAVKKLRLAKTQVEEAAREVDLIDEIEEPECRQRTS